MADTIVMYSSPEVSHLVAMVELAKLIVNHHPSLSITVLLTTPPSGTGPTAPYIEQVTATTPSVTFHRLPSAAPPPQHGSSSSSLKSYDTFDLTRPLNPTLHQTLLALSQTSNLKAFVIDFFRSAAFEVSSELNIPTYYFFCGSAHSLAALLYLPTLDRNTTTSLKDLGRTFLEIPGLPPVRASDMPMAMLDRTSKVYENFLRLAAQLPKSAGIIRNTFELMEKDTIKAISDGLCVPDRPTPPVFYIGPLITAQMSGGDDGHECLRWLDSQPSRSVVFLNFGSAGSFSTKQFKEMATGLDRSGVRFLWVVLNPPAEHKTPCQLAAPEHTPDSIFPEGFLGRTASRGLVVTSWVPQMRVLSHDSVGGHVTHCGWGSVFESVCAGVPMVGWPLYADQGLNMAFLAEELKLVLPVNRSEDGFVSADELLERVSELMDSGKGKAIRERVVEMREHALAALKEGGSSLDELAKFVESLNKGISQLDDSNPVMDSIESIV